MPFGVTLARANPGLVASLPLLETALTFSFGHPLRQSEHGSWLRGFAVGVVVLAESLAVYTFFEMKTELAMRFWKSAVEGTHAL